MFDVGAGDGVDFSLSLMFLHFEFSQHFSFGHVCVEQFDEVAGFVSLFLGEQTALMLHVL